MAPSQALRWSPGWEHGAENNHKRGHSFESGLTLKTKDDDLLLFNEMQNNERDNFLLHTCDDFDESLSKLRHFSNFKLGINIPTRGESSDLLIVEGDKNDYDWLLTPPDTPLFSSLDDEYPQPVNLAPRSRARSQPIMASRSVVEKSYQTSRTSSSPHMLSPSPRFSSTSAQMRGRPTLAPHSSTHRTIISTTPNRRPSTPQNKQSTPTSSSTNPPLRRSTTVSSIHSSNHGGRGPSPVDARRGKSASPKVRGWQMTLPGFTLEAPPNLRTSLSDRPISHTRGSSPASKNGSESSGRLGRKSMSPTSSRSISSSHSHERDGFSSYSKCSLVSSSDDYEESLRSITMGVSRSHPPKKDGALGSNKATPFSRKPSRNSPANGIPKRSFDSALRLMDQRKTPQNMFRPLLSSVPAATFRPIFSRNSSLTTSSNASSEQGVISVSLDVEGSELESAELPVGWEKTEDSETHEEVFLFDKVDEITEDATHEVLCRKPQTNDENLSKRFPKKFYSEVIENPVVNIGAETSCATPESVHFTDNCCDMGGQAMMPVCSKCGKKFKILHVTETIILCQECFEENRLCTEGINSGVPLTKIVASRLERAVGTSGEGPIISEVPEFHVGDAKVMLHQHEEDITLRSDSFPVICSMPLLDTKHSMISDQHLDKKKVVDISGNGSINTLQLSTHGINSSLKVEIPEGTGISVLLMPRPDSSKWPILQGKTVSATNIICSEPSYSRDNIIASRRSIGRDSPSTSSSVDLESSRQTESFIQQQLCKEGEAENLRNDFNSSAQSTSLPDLSINFYESRHIKSLCEETSSSTKCLGCNSLRERMPITDEHVKTLEKTYFNNIPSLSSSSLISENYISEHIEIYRTTSSLEGEQILEHQGNDYLPCSSAAEIMCNEDCIPSIHDNKYTQNESNVQNMEEEIDISGCSDMGDVSFQKGNFDEATKSSSMLTLELHGFNELEQHQNETLPSQCSDNPEESNARSLSQSSASDLCFSTSEQITAIQEHVNHEESYYVEVELPRGHTPRNLTLEEATDRILFCRSIIHDLAYKAVTMGMEKELNLPSEAQATNPTLPFLGKPIPSLRDPLKIPSKHTPGSQMFKRKKIGSQTKSPTKELKNDVNVVDFAAPNVEISGKIETTKPPKTESKCNCAIM